MEHTPTPWKVSDSIAYFGCDDFIKEHDAVVINGPCPPFALGFALAIVTGKTPDKEQALANAAFIVTACNSHEALVEACNIALHVFERIDRETPWSETEPNWWLEMTARMAVVRAALALAGVKP